MSEEIQIDRPENKNKPKNDYSTFMRAVYMYDLLYLVTHLGIELNSSVVIKGVDEDAYRSLKGEAAKAGLKVGEAASQAFRLWVQQRMLKRVRDVDRLKKVAERIDRNRETLKRAEGWSSVEVIRQWREQRKP
jgi:hypothetical protein